MNSIALGGGQLGRQNRTSIGGVAVLMYGLVAYAAFFVCIVYAMGFMANWGVPKSIDSGVAGPIVPAMAMNAMLLMLFVIQHTIMARPSFKRWWTKVIPASIERSTFVIAASACLALVMWQWRPMPSVIWNVGGWAGGVLSVISMLGWVLVFASSFAISHFDLFGVRQAWLRYRNQPYAPLQFQLTGLYKIVRHPLMVGFMVAIWTTPLMTMGHLFFAVMTTAYIFMGVWLEERDLIREHGEAYEAYRRRVPAFVPMPRSMGH